MHVATVFAIALAANLDNGAVGMALGIQGVRIPAFGNLLIALVGGFGTLAFGLAGGGVEGLLSPSVDHALAAAVLIGLGLGVILGDRMGLGLLRPPGREPDRLGLRDVFLLALALGINAWGGGLGAGLLGLEILPVTALTAAFSMVLLSLGQVLGRQAAWIGGRAPCLAGFLLIAIGLRQIL